VVHWTDEGWSAASATAAVAPSTAALGPAAPLRSATLLLSGIVWLIRLPGMLFFAGCAASAATPAVVPAGLLRLVWSFIHFRGVPAF
jgi:hypothetical protein